MVKIVEQINVRRNEFQHLPRGPLGKLNYNSLKQTNNIHTFLYF